MAIKAGSIVHVGNDTYLIDRIQTGGPGGVNIKRDTIREVGNYLSVGQIVDIPDLSFSLESMDTSCEIEALMLDADPTAELSVAITNKVAGAGIATLTTASTTGFAVGGSILVSGVDATLNGVQTITALTGTTIVFASSQTIGTTACTGEVTTNGNTYDLSQALPVNIKGQFKAGSNAASPYAVVDSVGIPYLILESMSYKFGIKENATQTATLKGSEIYYNPGSTYIESVAGLGIVTTVFAVTNRVAATGTATLTVASTTGLVAGMVILVAGMDAPAAALNGNQVITSVTGTTILFASAATITTGASTATAVQVGQSIVTSKPAYAVTEGGVVRRILAIGTKYRRLNLTTDYLETYGSVTLGAATTTALTLAPLAATDRLRIMYSSPTAETLLQSVHALVTGTAGTLNAGVAAAVTSLVVNITSGTGTSFKVGDVVLIDSGLVTAELCRVSAVSGTTQQTLTVTLTTQAHSINATVAQYVPTVKPAAIRGRDIDVYVAGVKKISVQSIQLDWKVTLNPDEEFGNYHYVDQDFEVPDVTGTIVFKPRDTFELQALMQQLSGTTDPLQSAPATTSPALALKINLKNPIDGRVLKSLAVSDARFDMPGYSAKVLQKLDFSVKFTSDSGALVVADH